MKIKSNALPQEHDSPHYEVNRQFCEDFERYVATKNGNVKGSYNAWSFLVSGKIEGKKPWTIKYKKATFSGAPTILWRSTKSQSIFTSVTWTCEAINTSNSKIFIRKKRAADRFNPRFKQFKHYKRYVIKSNTKETELLCQVFDILRSLFVSEEIYRLQIKNNKIIIELRCEVHYFKILDKLLEL
ncbi:hypothetical protein C8N46_10153 [Kordia periserrulae]|uniref:Uncharacterized protein n=1 Tax=Kordia periserrulae TaxID=701523 RepID=A0A2T6C580_9FLAO|nr:hypothetical protein [Kordia periserrulae]PTX63453.1 hypothetical protein C8N46_10153 [Kordia periserrulae]